MLLDEKIEVKNVNTDDGDHDKFQHYCSKKDISENLMTGKPMRALCGKIIDQQVDPEGRTVCQECKRWMDEIVGSNLPPGERD